jgi:hypothetical protein
MEPNWRADGLDRTCKFIGIANYPGTGFITPFSILISDPLHGRQAGLIFLAFSIDRANGNHPAANFPDLHNDQLTSPKRRAWPTIKLYLFGEVPIHASI